jgi:hypothetical protein
MRVHSLLAVVQICSFELSSYNNESDHFEARGKKQHMLLLPKVAVAQLVFQWFCVDLFC